MGHKGGSAHTPTLLDDNLKSKQFYRVLDLVSEGPIYGPVDDRHLSSFHVNGTPVTDDQGNININGIAVAWRPGEEDQEPVHGMDFIESTTVINSKVTKATPLVRTITDPDVTRLRFNVGVSSLVEQDDKGNEHDSSVTLMLEAESSTGWSLLKTVTITGKISGEYLEAHVVSIGTLRPLNIRVSRVTSDSQKDNLRNDTIWNSYTEIIDDSLSYPFSAIVASIIDHDQYADQPERTFMMRGLIVDIPDNYDPETRTYSGLWTGGWKKGWTNNPAWLFRELIKNTRFGLARHAGYVDVDDGSLFILSKYCDQLVDDGYGKQEPRLTLNAYITEQITARELLDKIAGMFRGAALWDGQRFSVSIDTPADPIAVVSNASVVDGKFTYSSTRRSERYNAVVVSWVDPANGWKTSKEYVSDDALIARFDYRETTLEAFGCTSRGQAYRAGRWVLETARRETKRVRFQMARDALHFMPGDIIEVQDNNHVGGRLGGRIIAHSGPVLTLDAAVDGVVSTGDRIGLMNAKGLVDHFIIQSVSGAVITLQSIPSFIKDGSIFVISASGVVSRLFRIMTISEDENNSQFTVTAAQHDPHKQAAVDEGAVFEISRDTLNGYRVPEIKNLTIAPIVSETVQMRATWETETTTRKLNFDVAVYTADGLRVINSYSTQRYSYDFYGLPSGRYRLGVRGRNETGMRGAETIIDMIIGAPSAPSSVKWAAGVFSAVLMPVTDFTLTSDVTFEFWFSGEREVAASGDVQTNAQFMGLGHQWTLNNLKMGTTYYAYIRTRNAFGASPFIRVSGQASNDAAQVIDFVRKNIDESWFGQEFYKKIDNSELNTNFATLDKKVTDTKSEIEQTVNKQLGDQTTTIQQIAQVQTDTGDKLNAMWSVKLQQLSNGQYYIAGLGVGMENTPAGMQSQILMAADRIAMVNPANGNTTPLLVAQNNQLIMNDVFLKNLYAAQITSSGNPPTFSLTPDGQLTARQATISGNITATGGSFSNVTIDESCQVKHLYAEAIDGDIAKPYFLPLDGTITIPSARYARYICIPTVKAKGNYKEAVIEGNNGGTHRFSGTAIALLAVDGQDRELIRAAGHSMGGNSDVASWYTTLQAGSTMTLHYHQQNVNEGGTVSPFVMVMVFKA